MSTKESIKKYYGEKLAEISFSLEAIKVNTENPFLWASGYRMPVYNDNRVLLSSVEARNLIKSAFAEILSCLNINPDFLAGTATAAIPWATLLADLLEKPLSYVRAKEKDHGRGNRIEGLAKGETYQNGSVVLIEDLISTGLSSVSAIKAIREKEGKSTLCLSIFTYNLKKAEESFSSLTPPAEYVSILTYDEMLSYALKREYINKKDMERLEEWKTDPFSWGQKRGFLKEDV